MSIVRKFLKAAARRSGYLIVDERYLEPRVHALFCRDLLATLDIQHVLDVGANTGQYRRFIRNEVGFAGSGTSFEPVPACAAAASAAARDDALWEVRQLALGRERGQVSLNVMKDSVFSSFLTPTESATSRFAAYNQVVTRIGVDVQTLDTVIPELRGQHRVERLFLKIDTQGHDLEVLRGAEQSLRTVSAIQVELSWTPIYEGMPTGEEVIAYLHARDFRLAGMFRIDREGYPTIMTESDAYFVRSE